KETGISAGTAIEYAALSCAAIVGIRFAWSSVTTMIIRAVDRRPAQRARRASDPPRGIHPRGGGRGAGSVPAALALPFETDAGSPLPGRDLILFLTFAVILFTLVVQGLTLPSLVRRLGVPLGEDEDEREEIRARLVTATAALERLDILAQ